MPIFFPILDFRFDQQIMDNLPYYKVINSVRSLICIKPEVLHNTHH